MTRARNEAEELSRAVVRIHAGVLAMVCALIGGIGLFGMTAWLLVKGGESVGLHLQLLRNYFIGYSVTWPGSLVGFFYGALVGGLIGWIIGKIYNAVAGFRQK
jgi:hypothetical protein